MTFCTKSPLTINILPVPVVWSVSDMKLLLSALLALLLSVYVLIPIGLVTEPVKVLVTPVGSVFDKLLLPAPKLSWKISVGSVVQVADVGVTLIRKGGGRFSPMWSGLPLSLRSGWVPFVDVSVSWSLARPRPYATAWL